MIVKQRQQHQRHLDLRQRQHEAEFGLEQVERGRGQAERQQRLVDDALARQDDDPGEGADHHRGQERHQDDEDQDFLRARACRTKDQRQRVGDQRRRQHGEDAELQRVEDHLEVEGVAVELGPASRRPSRVCSASA
jgi:hypothetical protein